MRLLLNTSVDLKYHEVSLSERQNVIWMGNKSTYTLNHNSPTLLCNATVLSLVSRYVSMDHSVVVELCWGNTPSHAVRVKTWFIEWGCVLFNAVVWGHLTGYIICSIQCCFKDNLYVLHGSDIM